MRSTNGLFLFVAILGIGLVLGLGVYERVNPDPAGDTRLFPVSVEGRQGYIDGTGRVVIEPRFCETAGFSRGMAAVRLDEQGKWGFIDKSGEMVIEPRFYETLGFSRGMAAVRLDERGKWGFIDKSGDMVIEPRFYETLGFSEGLAAVRLTEESQWGFIDKNGDWAIQPEWLRAKSFSDGYALVSDQQSNTVVVDKTGQTVSPAGDYVVVGEFAEGLAAVRVTEGATSRYGFIDLAGEVVVEPQFTRVWPFSDGMAMVCLDNDPDSASAVYGFIDQDGEILIEPQFGNDPESPVSYTTLSFSNGLAPVTTDGGKRFAYIDKKGDVVIQPQSMTLVGSFSGGLARVAFDGGGVCYIDRTGDIVWSER